MNSSITTVGGEKVMSLCETHQVTKDSFISVNSGGGSVQVDGVSYDNIGSYLIYCSNYNKSLKRGLDLIIPGKSSGGIDHVNSYEYQYEAKDGLRKLATNSRSFSIDKFNCYFTKFAGGSVVDTYPLPVYPQEFSDTNSADFNSQAMFGRSVSYQIYNTSSRSVGFTLQLHEEIVEGDYDYIHQLVAEIESACYPEYGANIVQPPEVMFIIGDHFKIRGILNNCSATWTPPIINGKLVNCSLSVGVVETTGPYSMSEVSRMRGYRGSSPSYESTTSTPRTTYTPVTQKPGSASTQHVTYGQNSNIPSPY